MPVTRIKHVYNSRLASSPRAVLNFVSPRIIRLTPVTRNTVFRLDVVVSTAGCGNANGLRYKKNVFLIPLLMFCNATQNAIGQICCQYLRRLNLDTVIYY